MIEKQYSAFNTAGDPEPDAGATTMLHRGGWPDSGALQEAISRSTKLPVIATDMNGIIQSFNRGAECLLGYTAADVVKKLTPVGLHDPEELKARARALTLELSIAIAPAFEALTCMTSRLGEDCYESTLIRKNRQRVPVAIRSTVLRDAADRAIGYLFFLTDLSDRRPAFKACEAPPAEPDSFPPPDLLVHLSHEMRTPLNAILGFAQLMDSATPPPTAPQKKSLDLILQAGWHLEKLITMIRDLALIESGGSSLSLAPVPLAAVMLECQAMIDSRTHRRGVRVIFPPLETPCFVSADRIRLQQVLHHVVSAAIEYSEVDGAVVVNCESRGAEWIHIGVNDAGSELSAQEGAGVEDLGIGLLLARRLVMLMGGAISTHSVIGARRLFSFGLTRVRVSMPEDFNFNSPEKSLAEGITRDMT